MVYSFIISTLLPGPSKILYSQDFGLVTSQTVHADRSVADVRADRRRLRQSIANSVHSEYQFRRSVANRTVEEDIAKLGNDDTLPELETGNILLNDDPSVQRFVAWMGAGYTGFALVCDGSENRLQAESVLKLLIRYLQEHVRVFTQPADVELKADRVALVLGKFLPQGTLLFMNNRVVRQLEKELDLQIRTELK